MDPIDLANSKTLTAFIEDYLPSSKEWNTWVHPTTKDQYAVTLQTSKSLSAADFDACFRLIALTSSDTYKASKDGWKPRSKKKEMKLLDIKYILVKTGQGFLEGFLSFMPTYEDGYPVIYCYEVHLSPELQGNQKAIKFYERLGYSKDDFSPAPKLLRNGTKIEPDYVILSKVLLDLSSYI
ncbi:putative Uncharacterized N-acetyltransferase [Glarea lozoyensis 74030]|uniref:Putative Uncharacterized N-acetyltransferase n=1 Tax=Glarea lozoyensis (strain ATCC 74030 / MF5533) TaxID=1104152 RepID=H0EM34_GLAL7|nr:putative Uncharacterized N-acetyltransferase [Glarea lozoyensis 74030]